MRHHSSFRTKITHSLLRFFSNRSFEKNVQEERKKKYLFEGKKKNDAWGDHYQKVRRGAYFRNLYSLYERHQNRITLAGGFLGIFLSILTLYILLLSPYFRISPNRVIIERIDEYSDINIAYKAIEDVYNDSLWFIEKSKIRSDIMNLEKNIKQVDISRLYPNGLKILLTSYPPVFQVSFPLMEKTFLLTENGILIPNAKGTTELPSLRIFSPELLESPFLDYKEAVSPVRMKRIGFILEVFQKEFSSNNITAMSYYKTENEIHAFLENGCRLIFTLDDSIDKQLHTLKIAQENTPGLLSSGEYFYIDVRIVGKLFTCKEKGACTKNLEKIYGNTLK